MIIKEMNHPRENENDSPERRKYIKLILLFEGDGLAGRDISPCGLFRIRRRDTEAQRKDFKSGRLAEGRKRM